MTAYHPKSLRAGEFISDAEIRETIAYAEKNKRNLALIDQILEKARPKKTAAGVVCAGLSHREASVLLACDIPEKIEEMYRLAREIKQAFYGNRIVMFAPLYLSNYCVNGCVYCPYHLKNKRIARRKLTQEEIRREVVALHSAQPYRIYMLGFLPGFPYLGGLDERLHTPRLSTPRTRIPAGSVGIGGKQTGVYPMESPGGWQLIGRTPLTLFAPGEPLPYAAGDRIRFVPIDEDEFERIQKREEAKRHGA